MEVRSTCGCCGNHIVEQCSCEPSPPPDVVEAARSLMSFDYNYMEPPVDLVRTVCEWVLSTNSTKQ